MLWSDHRSGAAVRRTGADLRRPFRSPDDRSTAAPLVRAEAAAAAEADHGEPDRPPAREGAHHRRTCGRSPSAGRRGRCSTTPTARPRRRSACSRARRLFAEMELQPSILRDVVRDRPRDVDPGRSLGAAVRVRADRIHPDDEPRGRERGRQGRRADRHPVRAVHDGHHLDRGRRGRRAGRAEVVPAVRVEGPRLGGGPGQAIGRRGVRGADADGRRTGRRCAAARRTERLHHPAVADRQDRAGRVDCTRPGGPTC